MKVMQLYRIEIKATQGQGEATSEALVVAPQDMSKSTVRFNFLTDLVDRKDASYSLGTMIAVSTCYVLEDV